MSASVDKGIPQYLPFSIGRASPGKEFSEDGLDALTKSNPGPHEGGEGFLPFPLPACTTSIRTPYAFVFIYKCELIYNSS